jgi:hypothetical protein
VRLLLDNNVLLWTIAGSTRVKHLRSRVVDDYNEVYVSSASFWEVATKAGTPSSRRRPGSMGCCVWAAAPEIRRVRWIPAFAGTGRVAMHKGTALHRINE